MISFWYVFSDFYVCLFYFQLHGIRDTSNREYISAICWVNSMQITNKKYQLDLIVSLLTIFGEGMIPLLMTCMDGNWGTSRSCINRLDALINGSTRAKILLSNFDCEDDLAYFSCFSVFLSKQTATTNHLGTLRLCHSWAHNYEGCKPEIVHKRWLVTRRLLICDN